MEKVRETALNINDTKQRTELRHDLIHRGTNELINGMINQTQ